MFRLSRLEFNKALKTPLFYIMIFLIILITYLTSFIYKPEINNSTNQLITFDEFSSTSPTSKKNIIDEKMKLEFSSINLIQTIEDRTITLNNNFKDIQKSINSLGSTIKTADDNKCKIAYENVIEKLTTFKTNLEDSTLFIKYEEIYKLATLNEYNKINEKLNELISLIENYKNNSSNTNTKIAESVYNLYTQNNYENHLINIKNNSINFIEHIITSLKDKTTKSLKDYINAVNQSTSITFEENKNKINEFKKEFLSQVNIFKNNLNNIINLEQFIFVNKDYYISLTNNIKKIIDKLSLTSNTKAQHNDNILEINKSNIINEFNDFNINVFYSKPSLKLSKKIQAIINKTNSNKTIILNKIKENKSKINECSKWINNYYLLGEYSSNLVHMLVLKDSLNNINAKISKNFYGENFNNYNDYYNKEIMNRYEYCINNNIYENSFINQNGYAYKVEEKDNGINYIYFSIKITSYIIIAIMVLYSILLITNEQKKGTLKFILARPYTRSEIVLGKLFALFKISAIFMLFNLAGSILFSHLLYGLPPINNNILATFNAFSTFKINYILYIILYSIFELLEVWFFIIISCFIAFLSWSVIGTLISSITAITGILALNLIPTKFSIIKFLPLYNSNLFKFFGSKTIISNNSSNFIDKLFNTTIGLNSNFWLSLLIISAYSFILILINLIIYKKRDF